MKNFVLLGFVLFVAVELARAGDVSSSRQGPATSDLSQASVSDLQKIIADSAAGLRAGMIRNAINESLKNGGLPAAVDGTATIDAGGLVIGLVGTEIRGSVVAKEGKWKFQATVMGIPERFDFSGQPRYGFVRDTGIGIVGFIGYLLGAKDFTANYVGDISIAASGNVRE